jgi:hypothetical protein
MALVETTENKDKRKSQELAAIEVNVSKSDDLKGAKRILVRQGQRLDVDGILERSLPRS